MDWKSIKDKVKQVADTVTELAKDSSQKAVETCISDDELDSSERSGQKSLNNEGTVKKCSSLISSALPHKRDETIESEENELVIDSVDSLNSYLQKLQSEASPAITMALQSQLQMLKHVQSPTMTLMAIDNIMVCLYKGLKAAESAEAKEELREIFTSLLQSFIFVSEARLKYEIDSNREESIHLLSEAGDLLMHSVESAAMMVVPVAAGATTMQKAVKKALPTMTNVLSTKSEQKTFLGRLIMVKGKKAVVEEKKRDFDKTLNFIFETLDRYAELVGPSIQLHGMLSRYAEGLAERYAIAQYTAVSKQISEKESSLLDAFVETSEMYFAGGVKNAIPTLFNTLAQVIKTPQKMDYDSVANLKRMLTSELENNNIELAKIESDIVRIDEEKRGLSFFQKGRKDELEVKLTKLNAAKERIMTAILDVQKRINIVSDIIDPANDDIKQYEMKLRGIVQKFEMEL